MNPIDPQLQAEEVNFNASSQKDMMMGDLEQQAYILGKGQSSTYHARGLLMA